MTRGQRSIVGLLAVIAVLLGLNLMTRGTTAAQGQAPLGPSAANVVGISSVSYNGDTQTKLYRLWSDGAIDQWRVDIIGPPVTHWEGWLDMDPVQRADLNADGCVNTVDLLSLLADWNPCG